MEDKKHLKNADSQPVRDVKKYTIELPRELLDDIRLAVAQITRKMGKTVLVRTIVIEALEQWMEKYNQGGKK